MGLHQHEIDRAWRKWLEVRGDGTEVVHDIKPEGVFAKPVYILGDGRQAAVTHDVVGDYLGMPVPVTKRPRGRGWKLDHQQRDHWTWWVRTPEPDLSNEGDR